MHPVAAGGGRSGGCDGTIEAVEFTGFGADLVEFFEGLRADNSRAYWQDHRAVHDEQIAGPLRALAADLGPEFGEAKIFRPYRDLRFSPDKRPYQEHASLGVGAATGILYLQVSADGLLLAGGYWRPGRDQLERWRRAVDDDVVAAGLDRTLRSLAKADFPMGDGDPVATAPRGWSRDHPRIDLIRLRSLTVGRTYEPAEWWHTTECRDVVAAGWRQVQVWNAWLGDHVGPTTEPATRR